jgi:hypothetical protein
MRSLFLLALCLAASNRVGPGRTPYSQDQSRPTYEAQWIEGSVRIDGVLSDPGWTKATWSRDFVDIRGAAHPPPHLRTRVKLLWDSTYLYVGADIEEPDIWGTLNDHDAIIYRDDDFELFIDPNGDGEEYYEIEINALGTILDLFLPKPYGRGGSAILEWDAPRLLSAIHLRGTLNDPSDRDRGWSAELAIPWSDLHPPQSWDPDSARSPGAPVGRHTPGTPPTPGSEWRVNFSRVDWPLEVIPGEEGGGRVYRKAPAPAPSGGARHPEENWVWSPQGAINMHLPEKWGVVRFLGPSPQGRDR